MFKIESYVTPLILSYVDKYIKNIKPEDSQVSLWGGDAVFHNLDLRLDVLEAELHSPFTFSSGHIHELRIHVPWTKLASESIVITINTIECTLKLKSTEDRASERSSQSQKTRMKRQEVAASPPGYMQSLISRMINNISIVCNNVILKYLEEDIVLSLNARTIALTSVDEKWEPAFTEFTSPDFVLRKAITVTDLTICLDQCNAQGKIPTYQEPLLYRCSLTVRVSSTYPSTIAARASRMRIDLLFPKLDFSLSDQQMPMFIRLFNLVLALYLGDFKNRPVKNEDAADNAATVIEDIQTEENSANNQSWAGWAWGYVPSILPVYWENETNEGGEALPSDRERVVQFGVFVERVNWTFKWAEIIRDVSVSSGPNRLRFQPFLTVRMQGCFLQVTLGGVEWVDVQGGISHLTLEPSSSCCLCGAPEDTTLYYLQGCERTAFLSHSLYDPNEEQVEHRFEWDDHIQRITEATILERTPALGFDYIYQLELPEDVTSEYLSQLGSELEYSNLPEKALFRLAVSPLQLKISYGLCHRLGALLHAAYQYNYPEYFNAELEIARRTSVSQDVHQLLNNAANLPSRTYQVAVLRPLIFISVSPSHPPFDLQRLVERRIIRMKDSSYSGPALPVLKLACTCADLRLVRPMYPIRLTLALQSMPSPPAALTQQCHTKAQLKLQDLAIELVTEEKHISILKPCNASLCLHSLLLPELWHDERILNHWIMNSASLEVSGSRPQLDYICSMWKILTNSTSGIPSKALAIEALNTDLHPALQLSIGGIRMDYIRTSLTNSAGCSIKSLNACILQPHAVPFFCHISDPHRQRFIECLVQVPHGVSQQKLESENVAPILILKIASYDVLLDPGWLKWLSYNSDTLLEDVAPICPDTQPGPIEPASILSNQSNCARDSGLSSSMDGQTWRASSLYTQTKSAGETPPKEPIDWLAFRRLLQRAILHVDIQQSSLVFPDDAQELRLHFELPAIYVSCPHFQTASLTIEDLPFKESGLSISSFPWTVNFQHFGLSSGYREEQLRPILKPISLKMTIALNPSTEAYPANSKPTEDRSPSIDLCIHIDMNAIEISLDNQQLKHLCDKTVELSDWLGASTDSSATVPVTHPDIDIGLWLQWAMPRFLLSLETSSSRTIFDMEDVTTSVDYQHCRYAKIKSRLTSLSIKLFTRGDEIWVLEPSTNGIVLSCVDEITRDLWPSSVVDRTSIIPPRSNTPSEVFQSQSTGKNGVASNTGGLLTLTFTRARRQDVHSKWQSRGRRKSNQTEEEGDEIVTPSDRYLNEVDIALEAFDIVVSEILLNHLAELAQPFSNSLARIIPSKSTVPSSSHSLPLVYATSKGLRIFFVDEKFLLLHLDGVEISPHVLNPIGRSVQLKPDLYYEAERQGLLYIPGHDIEDRQYQLDFNGVSLSSGCWKEVSQASWVWRTLNPASSLHTMAENPALEWNARQEQPSEPHVKLTPIVARCSFRTIYAPAIVSLEHQCVVCGQAIEVSAFGDLQLFVDANQIDYYLKWLEMMHPKSTPSEEACPSGIPSHAFLTSNRIGMIIYSTEHEGFLPFIYVSLIQPHVLVRSGEEDVHEIAIYDARLQLPCWTDGSPVKSCSLPDTTTFPISFLETRPGQPSGATGVPPSLFRLQVISSRRVAIEIGRPFKCVLHADNISNLKFLLKQLNRLQSGSNDSQPPVYRQIEVKSNQVLFEIPFDSAVVTAGLNEIAVNVSFQLSSSEEKWEKVEANLLLNGFTIKAEMKQTSLQLCDPLSVDGKFQVLWPHWLSDNRHLLHIFCRADSLHLHVGPRQIIVLRSLVEWFTDNYNPSRTDGQGQNSIDKEEQHYQDDLRTGAFDFQVRDTTGRSSLPAWHQTDEMPRPYQVVFNVQPASMCWAYPQPRALTRVDVHPIPLMKADGPNQDTSSGVEQVDCTLEFWDHCTQQFQILRRFSLSETRFTRVPLPNCSNSAYEQAVENTEKSTEQELNENQMLFSDTWRIVMHFTEENVPENRPKKIIAAPPSLVACTRIDSYFNSCMVPEIQLGVTFNQVSLVFHNQLFTSSMSFDRYFQLDGTMPTDFPFAAVNLSSISTSVKCRSTEPLTASFDFFSQVQVNMINFRYLIDEPVLEPTELNIKLLLNESRTLTALISSQRSMDINLSQCRVHTLLSCLSSWNAYFNGETDSSNSVLYAHYIVQNDTQDVLRVGQSGTGESILLTSRQAHQYAWKVIGERNRLHACTESGRWRWCQPCDIDRPGVTVCSVVENRPRIPLIWSIKTLNSLQKEVTVRGQVQVASLLPHTLEVKLIPSKSEQTSGAISLAEMRGQVSANSIAPSFIFPLEYLQAMKVRLPGNSWSGLIPLVQAETKTRNVLLVRVAQKDKEDSLNIWCHLWIEKVDQQNSRLLILLSPLYMVRSYLPQPLRLHLRTPGLNSSLYSEIEGRGIQSVLECPGSVDHGHQLSFQLSSSLPESTPPVPLSWTMAAQYAGTTNQQAPFIDDLLDEVFPVADKQADKWPFTEDLDFFTNNLISIPQPKTDVRVTFSSLHQRCHSLLVELKPWALLINHSGIDLVLKRSKDSITGCWILLNRAVMAPPPMNDDTFQIGLAEDGQLERACYSQPLLLQDQDQFHFMYRPRVEGAIPQEGYCSIRITTEKGGVCFFTLTSKMHDGIRILCIEPTFRIHNDTGSLLKVGCLIGDNRLALTQSVVAPKGESRATPLLIWQGDEKNSDYLYLFLRLCADWSCPVQLFHSTAKNSNSSVVHPQRYSVSLPLSPGCQEAEAAENCPLVVTRLEQGGLVYLAVAVDPNPLWVLVNRTEFALAYAQASETTPGQPEWDCSQFCWHGTVHSNGAVFYTPPWGQQRYLDVSPPTNLPRLLLALDDAKLEWSQPVHPSHAYDQFLSLSPTVDVVIRIVRTTTPNQATIYIEPVNRVQISASDIRGRIETQPPPPPPPVQKTPIRTLRPSRHSPCKSGIDCRSLHQIASDQLNGIMDTVTDEKQWKITIYYPEISICLRDDTNGHGREVTCLTADHVLAEYFQSHASRLILLRCGHLQLDNQMYVPVAVAQQQGDGAHGFDFPVVFLAQNQPNWPNKSLSKLLEKLRQNSFLVLEVTLTSSARLSAIDFQLDPVYLFIEDRYIAITMDYFNSFFFDAIIPVSKKRSSNLSAELVSFPERIAESLSSHAVSVNLDQLKVRTISLDFSLRSSVKLYIALDHSPLRLDAFERTFILTTPYKLGQTLAKHYVSSALFKAGWVVGSMELLGSPTALARTVTLGLKDFVRLPYQGIWRGPRGFLAGILNGSASLVSHVTAGTVTSVTQLASSVARNVDRLSFDLDFQQRSEEGRRKKPQGLAQGIGWGLSALGLSLLGALGGLAHHPLQSLIEDGTFSPHGLAIGFTKGIVGVVAKPISGAADLVAQTGQGLLSATQWSEPFRARRPQSFAFNQLDLICAGPAKILWKLSDETPPLAGNHHAKASRICCCLEAMRARVNDALPIREQLAPVILLISTQNFCVLNAEDGEVQVVLDLNEVDCWAHQTDPTLILVRPTPLTVPVLVERREEDFNPQYDYQRVSEFVRVTTPFFLPDAEAETIQDATTAFQTSSIATMEFFLNPATKEFFVQCFQMAKRQRNGVGFALL